MPISKPYHRFYRRVAGKDGNEGYNSTAYIEDREYAQKPELYLRSFLLIQEDLKRLFDYIEPSDANLKTYSFRIYELFIRICLEVEANFKAILRENKYSVDSALWTIKDYKKICKSHHLGGYRVKYPVWTGSKSTFAPFGGWEFSGKLDWYDVYNKCKHNRYENMPQANFNNLLKAFAGLTALLYAQFCDRDFQPGDCLLSVGSSDYYACEFAAGEYMMIEYPLDWSDDELYDFSWDELQSSPDRFDMYDFDMI